MRISIIIPAFNAAQTIRTTLDSVSGQADEIIVVDDGSSDGTSDLVTGEYPGVVLLKQENRGVSAARNSGMAVATGDYLVFVDADDILFPDALLSACGCLDGIKSDLVILRSFSGDVEQYPWTGRFKPGKEYGKEDIIAEGYVRGSVWGCLYRRAFLERNQLVFPVGISMAEDQIFLNAVIAQGASICFLDVRFYDFKYRPDSASRSYNVRFFHRLADALFAAPRFIQDSALCSHVCLSIILGMTRVAVSQHRSPSWIRQETDLEKALPLSVRGMKKGRQLVWLLNKSYPLLYRAVQVRMLFQ